MAEAKTLSNDKKARLAGLVLVVLGGGLFKLKVLDVLRDAEAGVGSIATSTKAVVVAPFLVLVGLLLLVVGAPDPPHEGLARFIVQPHPRKLTPLGWAITILLILPGIALQVWLSSRLKGLGYK